jgi:hypothetical protein
MTTMRPAATPRIRGTSTHRHGELQVHRLLMALTGRLQPALRDISVDAGRTIRGE